MFEHFSPHPTLHIHSTLDTAANSPSIVTSLYTLPESRSKIYRRMSTEYDMHGTTVAKRRFWSGFRRLQSL